MLVTAIARRLESGLAADARCGPEQHLTARAQCWRFAIAGLVLFWLAMAIMLIRLLS